MTEKHDYTATVRRKGLDNTGVTQDIARQMYTTPDGKTLAIVEVKHIRQVNDTETGRNVELSIQAFEPSTSDELDTYLRQLMKTLHQNRVLTADDQQLQIDTQDDLEPTVEAVIAAGEQHVAQTDDELPAPDEDQAEAADEPWEYDGPEGGNVDTEEPVGASTT